jgi:predicted dehydrogenase
VTFDLMVHDIDLALALIGEPQPVTLEAEGRTERGDSLDAVRMQARFAGGTELELSASRIADDRRRTMRVEYDAGTVEIDFVARRFENTTGYALNAAFLDTPEGRDPLGANVARFIDAALGRRPAPAVSGPDGAAAARLAEQVDQAAAR